MGKAYLGITFGLALLFAGGAPLHAQDITVGIKGGLNIADLEIDDPAGGEETDTRSVFAGGVFVQFGIGDVLAVQPEVLYSQKGATDTEDGVELTFKLNYIEVPVLLKARIPIANSGLRPNFYAGPVVAFETKCEVKGSGPGISATADCDAISDFGADEDIETKSVDLGVTFGVGLEVPAGPAFILGDARYTLGLTDINDTPIAEEVDIKNRTWSFFVGAGIPIGP